MGCSRAAACHPSSDTLQLSAVAKAGLSAIHVRARGTVLMWSATWCRLLGRGGSCPAAALHLPYPALAHSLIKPGPTLGAIMHVRTRRFTSALWPRPTSTRASSKPSPPPAPPSRPPTRSTPSPPAPSRRPPAPTSPTRRCVFARVSMCLSCCCLPLLLLTATAPAPAPFLHRLPSPRPLPALPSIRSRCSLPAPPPPCLPPWTPARACSLPCTSMWVRPAPHPTRNVCDTGR